MNGLTKLVSITLLDRTVYLSDGGVTVFDGNVYVPSDPVIGSIQRYGELTYGFGDELPEWEFILSIPSNSALTPLQSAAKQALPVRYWFVEYDAENGEVTGIAHSEFSGRLDRVRQQFGFQQLGAVISCVAENEALLKSDDGNGLSAEFHKAVYPGETGHDQATGLVQTVTWGVESVRRGGRAGGGGGGGFGDQFRDIFDQVQLR